MSATQDGARVHVGRALRHCRRALERLLDGKDAAQSIKAARKALDDAAQAISLCTTEHTTDAP